MDAHALHTQALQYLQRDPLGHIAMLEALRRGHAQLASAGPDGVLLREQNSGVYMLSVPDACDLVPFLAKIKQPTLIVAHQKRLAHALCAHFGLTQVNDCRQAAFLRTDRLPVCGRFSITPLTAAHADIVAAHYHTVDDTAYIEDRIAAGAMWGAFMDGALAGFVGIHDEGSMGMLEVLPAYRRMGAATALESHLINLHLSRGHTPFCHIFADNASSLALQQKLGLAIADAHVYWVL